MTTTTLSIAAVPELVDDLALLARDYTEAHAFVSLLAHELRTRLKVTELALAGGGEDGLETARANTGAVQELVEDLIELARGDAAGTAADANDALATVVDDLDGAAIVVSGDLGVVRLPLRLLETVLRNLVVNAVEAGAATIEVFARSDGTICVRDDGPGVSRRQAAKIFDVYSGKFGGAGLGLTLCREILRRRGGDLWLEPPSTFCFRVR